MADRLTPPLRMPGLPSVFSPRASAPISPMHRVDSTLLLTHSDRWQPPSFPAFTLKKSYWHKHTRRDPSPRRSMYASMPVFFVQHPPPGRPKPPPPPHKDLISALPKARLHYYPSSKLRKSQNLQSENDLWRPLAHRPSPREENKDWTIEACRNMYLTYDTQAGRYGVKYKDEVKDGFQHKVLGYLEAHKEAQNVHSQSAKKTLRGRLRLHPDKAGRGENSKHSQVSPVVTPITIV